MPATLAPAIPILRIFDLAKAREFYVDFLGFRVDSEHRFAPDAPAYLFLSRDGCRLHLSEHHGDACPGSTALVPIVGIDAYQQQLIQAEYKYNRPGVEATEWGTKMMEVIDPFGNRLRFHEEKKAGADQPS